ncbi:hypothetical protein CN481_17740 [Bacillus sp. AFS006103]|nr:hypothetical protein CN481_17740 [Bacillus sp. AFS006103]
MDSAKFGRYSANYRGYSAKLGRDSAKLQKDTAEFAYDSANPLLVTFFNRGTSPFTVCLAAGARIMDSANYRGYSAKPRKDSAKLGRDSAKLQKDSAESSYDSANPLLVIFFNRGMSPFTVCLAAGARITDSANYRGYSAKPRKDSAKLGRYSAKTSEGFRRIL